MKKILALALAIVLALSTLSLTAFAAEADHGTILDGVVNNADPSATFITAEIDGLQANESVEVKLYSGDTLLATTTWKKEFPIADAKGVITTVKICITATSSSWETVWEEGKLSADYIPDKATLIVDGVECNTALIEMIDTELEPVAWADIVPYYGTLLDGVVNNADPSATFITAEIDGLNAKESVAIKLYSGDTLLATTTWKKEFPIADAKGVITTVKICITATSSSWETVWEKGKLSADYIPDSATLIVDGVECNTALIEMINTDLEDVVWADTVPYRGALLDGVVNVADPSATYITAEIDGLNAKESVVIKLYSGDTLLATTTWKKEFPIADEKGVITTVKICITATSSSWETVWETGKLSADYIPDSATLIVDDVKCNTALIEMINTDLEPVDWAEVIPANDIIISVEGEGTVVASKSEACVGEKIDVTFTPAEGYSLGYSEVLDAEGNAIAFEDGSFIMPEGEVTIIAYFTELPVYEVYTSVLGTGRVSTAQDAYLAGATVRLNITHDVGYSVRSISVIDAWGNSIPVDGNSFVMPDCEVEVNVVFVKVLPKPAIINFVANVDLEGADLEAGSFKFQLSYLFRGKEYVIETATNDADGKVEFAPIYTYAPQSYTFFIKQIALDDAGVEYDAVVYEIDAVIDYSKGYLAANVSETTVDFVNYVK